MKSCGFLPDRNFKHTLTILTQHTIWKQMYAHTSQHRYILSSRYFSHENVRERERRELREKIASGERIKFRSKQPYLLWILIKTQISRNSIHQKQQSTLQSQVEVKIQSNNIKNTRNWWIFRQIFLIFIWWYIILVKEQDSLEKFLS